MWKQGIQDPRRRDYTTWRVRGPTSHDTLEFSTTTPCSYPGPSRHCDIGRLTYILLQPSWGPYTSTAPITQGPVLYQRTTETQVWPWHDVVVPGSPSWVTLKRETLLHQNNWGPSRDRSESRILLIPRNNIDPDFYTPTTTTSREQMEKGR